TPKWGYTESVLVDGDRVICTPGGSKGTMAALDRATGKTLWQSKEWTDGAHYSSPLVREIHGVRQYIQLTEKTLAGVRASDGKVLWRSPWPGTIAVIPTPIEHENHVYVTSGYGVGSKLVEVAKDFSVKEVYFNKNMKNHHGGVIRVGEHLYGYSDGVGWLCQDFKSGEIVWREKDKLGKGAIACADGMLYCLSEQDGSVVLIDASPKGWNERGRFVLDPKSKSRSPRGAIWTHPVISNGRLYLRDQEYIYCYDVKAD